MTAYRVAAENLKLGLSVVADSVNPLNVTRDAWADVARHAQTPLVEVEVICSDHQEHRARVETRRADIEGLSLPSWEDVSARQYDPWHTPHIVLNTSRKTVAEAYGDLVRKLAEEAPRLTERPVP